MEPWYHLKITNKETQIMFARLFRAWFDVTKQAYHKFIKAMMENDLEIMNYYMNRVTQETFSYFDVGSGETGLEETERFYHGFVLGLMLAYVYEKYGSLKAPAAAHMAMNLLSVLATRYGLYNWMLKDNIRIGIITVVCAAVASTMFVIIQRIEEKPTKKKENENLAI